MNSSNDELKKIFEYELKLKLSSKAKHFNDEYKYLLNCFKFYDINNEGEVDNKIWIKAILKTGITGFSENDLDSLYNTYLANNFDKIDYKDFCNYIFGRERTDALSKSLKNNIFNNNSNNNIYEKKSLFNTFQNIDLNQYNKNNINNINKGYESISNVSSNKTNRIRSQKNLNKSQDNSKSEDLINKIKEKIHIDNGVVYYSFMKFLKINEEPKSQKVSLEDISITIQELHLNISSVEIHDFYNYLDSEKEGRIPTNKILNLIKGPLDDKRKDFIKQIFSNIDNDKKGEISINSLKNLYNAKNHPDVLDGKKSEQEIYNQFCYTIDVYIRVKKILNNCINNDQFIDYYSGISPSIKNDEDFKNILQKVWLDSQKNKFKNKSGYNNFGNNYDDTNGNNDIGINSIFLGVSHTQRPKYDYNYDYLEEFSKSSPNVLSQRKTAYTNKYNNKEKEKVVDNNIVNNYIDKKNNSNTSRNNFRNRDLNNLGNSLNNYEPSINQTISYSNIFSHRNLNKGLNDTINQKKFFNYESREPSGNKGIKVFKLKKRYNPITDEYMQSDDIDNNSVNSNIISQEIQKKISTPQNNLYINNNYNQNNSQNNYINNYIQENNDSQFNKENNNNNENNNMQEDNEINNNNLDENNNSLNIQPNNSLKENNSLIKFRNMLISRGNKSIFRLQRMLSIYDRNHSGLISFDNFYTIFQAYYVNFPISDIKSIFSLFDTTINIDNNNNKDIIKDSSMFKIKYDELLKSLIGNMPIKRQLLVKKVFDSFEKDLDGKIMTSDIKSKYNYRKHPDVLSGKFKGEEVYSDFLDFLETFREYNDNLKGGYSFTMTFEEFLDFYKEISMSIEDDDYFENLLINCWDINEENNDINENNIDINNNIENKNIYQKEKRYYNGANKSNSNSINNNYNDSNIYQRRKDNYNNRNNNNEYSQNIRMKVGKQIMNNNIF